jgi:hypothetical protein
LKARDTGINLMDALLKNLNTLEPRPADKNTFAGTISTDNHLKIGLDS